MNQHAEHIMQKSKSVLTQHTQRLRHSTIFEKKQNMIYYTVHLKLQLVPGATFTGALTTSTNVKNISWLQHLAMLQITGWNQKLHSNPTRIHTHTRWRPAWVIKSTLGCIHLSIVFHVSKFCYVEDKIKVRNRKIYSRRKIDGKQTRTSTHRQITLQATKKCACLWLSGI